jgi:GntR family transcriptional regulator
LKPLSERIQLDFRSSEPNYLQIVRQIENLVRQGELKPGDQLPTVRALATDLRINFSTVARAYHILDEQRLISTQRGRGTYIWETPSDEEKSRSAQLSLAILSRQFWRDARLLGMTDQEIEQALAEARLEPVNSQDNES